MSANKMPGHFSRIRSIYRQAAGDNHDERLRVLSGAVSEFFKSYHHESVDIVPPNVQSALLNDILNRIKNNFHENLDTDALASQPYQKLDDDFEEIRNQIASGTFEEASAEKVIRSDD